MGLVLQPSNRRLGQVIAESKNVGDTLTTQQQSVISATGVTNGIVAQNGVVTTPTPAGTPGPSWPYLFNSETANEDPGSGHLAFNSNIYADVTAIYVDDVNNVEGNIAQQLSMLPAGVTLNVVFGTNIAVFTLNSVTVHSNYVTLGVTFMSFSGPGEFLNGYECLFLITTGLTRYGTQYFDQYGVLQAQIDQFGFHAFYNASDSSSGPAVYNGEVLPPSSQWVPLALASGITGQAGAPTPSARLEPAGVVRLKGQLYNSSGSTIPVNTTLATVQGGVESGFLPYWLLQFPVANNGLVMALNDNGAMSLSGSLLAAEIVCLDGITYTVN